MPSVISSISQKNVKDLFNYYQFLTQHKNQAVGLPSKNDRPTIIVLGCGLSGITAAKELTEHGFNVLMLEARDRIGGRIHSLHLQNECFLELGAQFVHGIKDNPLYKICEKYKLEVKPYSRGDWAIFDVNGTKIDKENLEDLVEKYKDELHALSFERKSDNKDRFMVEDLKLIDQKILKHKAIQSSDIHSLAKLISIKEFNEEKLFQYKLGAHKKESESNFLVTNGYIKILEGMLSDAQKTGLLEVRLSTEINEIHYTSYNIAVHSKKGETFHADAIICTLPLGVLKSGNIRFTPNLPKLKVKSINKLKMAIHNKMILEFEEVFWDNLSHFVVLYDPTLNAWLDMINLQFFYKKKTPIFMTSIYSSSSQDMPSDIYLVNHFVNLIKRIYPDTFKPLKNHWVTHWEQDPYALGAYSYHPEGTSLEDNSEIAKPMGRVIFAGEHTHRSPSNVQAAYLSGFESAKQVVDQLLDIYKLAAAK
ncbi:MAG: flavin monoamine oxidase family protein [Candidatus Berkiellales bacterium]